MGADSNVTEWFILLIGMEEIAGEYRGLDRKSAYLSGVYRIGMVQLIKRKGADQKSLQMNTS